MYVPDHLKLRIALARQLKAFYYEDGNSSRNRKRIYRAYGKYLGTTYFPSGVISIGSMKTTRRSPVADVRPWYTQ